MEKLRYEMLYMDLVGWEYDITENYWSILNGRVIKVNYKLQAVSDSPVFIMKMAELDGKNNLIQEYLFNGMPFFFRTRREAKQALIDLNQGEILESPPAVTYCVIRREHQSESDTEVFGSLCSQVEDEDVDKILH